MGYLASVPADVSILQLKPETRDGKTWLGQSWVGQREGLTVIYLKGSPFEIGYGAKRTPRLAAAYADDYNVGFDTVAGTKAAFDRVRAAVEAAGRPGTSMIYSAAQVVCCGLDDAELKRRAAAIGQEPAALREQGLAGSPAELVDKIGQFAGIGAGRIYLQVLDLDDLEHLELIAAEVLPHV